MAAPLRDPRARYPVRPVHRAASRGVPRGRYGRHLRRDAAAEDVRWRGHARLLRVNLSEFRVRDPRALPSARVRLAGDEDALRVRRDRALSYAALPVRAEFVFLLGLEVRALARLRRHEGRSARERGRVTSD
eukprot:30745-Pelagococcus_subviridis.AAC.7